MRELSRRYVPVWLLTLVTWMSAVAISFVYLIACNLVAEEPYSLSQMWNMGMIPIGGMIATFIALLLLPLAIWAGCRLSTRQALARALVLFTFLAGYFIGYVLLASWGWAAGGTFLANFGLPVLLAVLGLVLIGFTGARRPAS